MGGGVGIWVKLYPRLLFNFVGSYNASTSSDLPEKRGFSLSASKNVFRWWVYSFGIDLPRGQIFPFYPKTIFSGPNKAIILHASE